MTKLSAAFLFAIALCLSPFCIAGGLGPWKFGMSKSEVTAVAEFAPYKSFANGDLETREYPLESQKENVQFFFDDKGLLRRIGVYRYEGPVQMDAVQAWRRTYEFLKREYGGVNSAVPQPGSDGKPLPENPSLVFSMSSLILAELHGKVQMAPAKQPEDVAIFSSFIRATQLGRKSYLVILYFDRPAMPVAK